MEARTGWTDERLDDLAGEVRSLPVEVARVAKAVEGLTEETRALRTELGEETRSIRSDLSQSQRQIAQIGWVLAVALLSAVAGLLIALL